LPQFWGISGSTRTIFSIEMPPLAEVGRLKKARRFFRKTLLPFR